MLASVTRMVGRSRMDVGRVLITDSMASKPRKVVGGLYTLTRRAVTPAVNTVQAVTSLDGLSMGWMVGLYRELMYMQDRGLDDSLESRG